tara:strand:- start:29 stop:448 length:420 start_codon:yes stop_codon:yes gene_type:complete
MTSIIINPEKEVIDVKVLLKQRIEYLQRFYHRAGETDKIKELSVILTNYQKLNLEDLEIINTIEDIAGKYENLEDFFSSLELYYEILKIKKKIQPDNKGSIITTWEKIMILNSAIGNKDEARKIFLYTKSLRGCQSQSR